MTDGQQTLPGVDEQETLELDTLETHLWETAGLIC